ncbi:hypothetical protein RI367_004245 [Sorochytrium milnesiophthora]
MNAFTCLFCSGSACRYCGDARPWKQRGNALSGLYSNWITDDVLAMQRPSTRVIEEFSLLSMFQSCGIGAIINLQEIGEHPRCGDGIQKCGFSYDPELWMKANFFYYNFAWRDMEVPTLSYMLGLVKVMTYEVESGRKVAVHCHAGLGRTGLAIACYLIYRLRFAAEEAIQLVRERRPGSVQTSRQVQFVHTFARYIDEVRQCVSPRLVNDTPPPPQDITSLHQWMDKQRMYLHGDEARVHAFVPKVMTTVCDRLLQLQGQPDEDRPLLTSPDSATPSALAEDPWSSAVMDALFECEMSMSDPDIEQKIGTLQGHLDREDWSVVATCDDIRLLVHCLCRWIGNLPLPSPEEPNAPDIGGLLAKDKVTSLTLQSVLRIPRQTTDEEMIDHVYYYLAILLGRDVGNWEHNRALLKRLVARLPPSVAV